MISHKVIDDQIAVGAVFNGKRRWNSLAIRIAVWISSAWCAWILTRIPSKTRIKECIMKIEWKIRVLSVFLIVSIVFLRSEELFPHNGSTHHSRFWCHVPPAVIDFWVFTEGHLHTDFLTDDAGVGIFSGGFYGCERSSYNIGTSGPVTTVVTP